jgi:hypothetical protein
MAYDTRIAAEVARLKDQIDVASPSPEEYIDHHRASIETIAWYNLSIAALGAPATPTTPGATAAEQAVQTTALTNILAELRDDRQMAETVWYDRTNPAQFYIRRLTVDEDTGLPTISFTNIDGTTATPTIANLVQSSGSVVPIAPSRRTISTNGTGVVSGGSAAIAADAISYQIISIAGSFTITGDNTTYSASGPLMGVMGDPMVGKKYPAITVTPAINSQIWIEEIR